MCTIFVAILAKIENPKKKDQKKLWVENEADLTSVEGVADKLKKVMLMRRACHTELPRYWIRAESGKVTFTMRSVCCRYSPGGTDRSRNGIDTSFRPVNRTNFADTLGALGRVDGAAILNSWDAVRVATEWR